MKKVLCVIAAVAMVAVFATSCKKDCTCKTYMNGKETASITIHADQLEAQGIKCADMSSAELDGVGVTCK